MADYKIYGLSKQGMSSMHNCDNIYMNGIYMDSFVFSLYEKDLSESGNTALIIICGGLTDNDISKELLSEVKELCEGYEDEEAEAVIKKVSGVVEKLDMKYGGDKKPKLDVGILAVKGSSAFALSYGNIGMLMNKGNSYTPVFQGSGKYSVGVGNIAGSRLKPVEKKLSKSTRFLLYTDTVAKAVDTNTLIGCLKYDTPGECIQRLKFLSQIQNLDNPGSVVCMDFDTGIESGGKVANIVLGLIIAAIIAAVVTMGITLFGTPDSNSAKSRETIEKLEKEGKLKEEVNKLRDEANAIFEIWAQYDAEVTAFYDNVNQMIASGSISAEEVAEVVDIFTKFDSKYSESKQKQEDVNNETDIAEKFTKYTELLSEEGFAGEFTELYNKAKQKYDELLAYAEQKAAQANASQTPNPTTGTAQKQNTNTNTNTNTKQNASSAGNKSSANVSSNSGGSNAGGSSGNSVSRPSTGSSGNTGSSSANSSGSSTSSSSGSSASRPSTGSSGSSGSSGGGSASSSSGSSNKSSGGSSSSGSSSNKSSGSSSGTGGGHNTSSKNLTAIE